MAHYDGMREAHEPPVPSSAKEYANWVLTGSNLGIYQGPLVELANRIEAAILFYADNLPKKGKKV